MRAFRVEAHESAGRILEVATPDPEEGEVRVSIQAAGLNFADLLMIKGTYQDIPPLPFTLGLECAGVVDALGGGVTGLAKGDRVAVYSGHGGLAEYGCFPASTCVPIPASMPFEVAAGFQITYGTSHVALTHRGALSAGETLVVLGAAGGVGLTAVEIGKALGARVIAVARGADKLQVVQSAGADHVLDGSDDNLRDRIKELGGCDVVYDPVGGAQGLAAFRALRPEGRHLVIGFASGDVPAFPANIALVKNLSVVGVHWGAYRMLKPSVLYDSLAELLGWYENGKLSPLIGHKFGFEDTQKALDLLRDRKATGKVVVTI